MRDEEKTIDQLRWALESQAVAVRILALLNQRIGRVDTIREILGLVKEFTGFEAVAIRLRDGEDYPYFVTRGFPDHFVEAENYLCAHDQAGEAIRDSEGVPVLECMCGNIIRGRTDPSFPFFTEGGSFWANSTSKLLASTTEENRQARTRDRCNSEGYESVALIPLRSERETIGLLQLNDSRENCFTPEMILFFEGIGASIGIVLTRGSMEEALRESERMLRSIVSACPVGLGLGQDGELKWVNEAWRVMFGFQNAEECIGQDERTLYPSKEEFDRVGKALYAKLEDGRVAETDATLRRRDGTVFDGHIRLNALDPSAPGKGTIIAVADISDRKRTEDLLIQSERIRSVANLADGVAHNFNNLLQIILGNAEFGLLDLDEGNPAKVRSDLETIIDRSRFGAGVVKSLQSFTNVLSGKTRGIGQIFDLSRTVEQAIELSRPWWKTKPEKEGIEFFVNRIVPRGCLVEGHESELLEVLVGLIRNACDASPRGGEIKITTSVHEDEVLLRVQDNGVGIPKENLGKVFEPFWTDKDPQFVGMGLASALGIVKRHGGDVFVDSEEGKGATFTVRLPLAETPVEDAEPLTMPTVDFKLRILVVDDEPLIVRLVDRMLTRYGQTVLTALSGEEAIEIFADNPVDLVICDLGMPGMDGWEVFRKLRVLCEVKGVPKQPFILLTGFSGQALEKEKITESGVDGVVDKPLDSEKLLQAIREVVKKAQHQD